MKNKGLPGIKSDQMKYVSCSVVQQYNSTTEILSVHIHDYIGERFSLRYFTSTSISYPESRTFSTMQVLVSALT